MAKFTALDEYFDPGLDLSGVPPLLDKEYRVPLPSAELGLWCRRMAQAGAEIHAASSDEELQTAVEQANARVEALPKLPGDLSFEERLLGPIYGEMTADGVADPYVQFCAQTAYVWIVGGEEAAERYWKSGGRPEAPGPANRKERRAQARTGRTSTGGDATTRTPASTSGTRSPTRSRGSGRARGSRGKRS